MHTRAVRRLSSTALLISSLLVTAPALASPAWTSEGDPAPNGVIVQRGGAPDPMRSEAPSWGVASAQSIYIATAAFNHRRTPFEFDYLGKGYVRAETTLPQQYFWAPVDLPAGAVLEGFRVFYWDTSVENNIWAWLTRYWDDEVPEYEDLAIFQSPDGTPGYASEYVATNQTIRYVDETSGEEQAWSIVVRLWDPGLAFRGVRISYRLAVSPAPASATFTDVPTDHPFFQFVEALAASGITAGCAADQFCPDNPVTRGQMAVFLTKALGLHWTE